MKIILFLILSLPMVAFASMQQHLNIAAGKAGDIFFVYAPYQKLNNPVSKQLAAINPITCKFSTKYNGHITFDNWIYQDNPEIPHRISITNSTPFIHTFTKPIYFGEDNIAISNKGCNSGTDGDKCIQAKQKDLDGLIVDCE